MASTPATKALEAAGISFEVREFVAREFTAEEAAGGIAMPLDQVVKTLVARSDSGEVVMALVTSERELSTRALARLVGARRMDLVDPAELRRLTGYLKGGVSPLGIRVRGRSGYPVYVDEAVLGHALVAMSAGRRGMQVLLNPRDLVRATSATVAALTA